MIGIQAKRLSNFSFMRKTLFLLLLILALAMAIARAQSPPEKIAAIPKVDQPLPFKAGETLAYEISFSKLIFSGTIGDLKLTITKLESGKQPERLELQAEATSKGFFPKLFGLKVKDRYNAIVNATDMGLHSSAKFIDEGRVRKEQTTVIDRQSGRVTFTDRDLANAKAEPNIKQAPSPAWIQDMISACYFVRTQKLQDGDVMPIPISDGGAVYNIEVVVEKREEVKVEAGKFKAIRLNAKVFDGRYIKRSGEMFIWISDDGRRIPVKAKIKTSGATVTIDLKRIE
jgi:hypothetical protein